MTGKVNRREKIGKPLILLSAITYRKQRGLKRVKNFGICEAVVGE